MAPNDYHLLSQYSDEHESAHDEPGLVEFELSAISDEKPPAFTTSRPIAERWMRAATGFVGFLKPSFLLAESHAEKRVDGSLAALDGLRGLACLCVLNQHTTQVFTERLYKYGYKTAPTDVYFPQWPFVRILWTGSAQVFTFFVLSGYVLSVKPLKQMRNQDLSVLKTLSSSVFRRGMRLFLPSIAVLIIVALVTLLGLYKLTAEASRRGLIAVPETFDLSALTADQTTNALQQDILGMTNFFNVNGYVPILQRNLWTINAEFRGSMLLFLFQIGTTRLQGWVRAMISFGMVVMLGYLRCTHTLLFFCGTLLAELDLIYQDFHSRTTTLRADENALTLDVEPAWHWASRTSLHALVLKITHPKNPTFRLFHLLCFIFAVYIMCVPFFDAHGPGYSTLTTYLTPFWFHADSEAYALWTLGSVLLLSSATHSIDILPLYTNRFSQYVGRISFALYIIQGPVLQIACYGMLPILEDITAPIGGRQTQLGFTAQWLMAAMISWPIVVYMADLTWRALDVPSVAISARNAALTVIEASQRLHERSDATDEVHRATDVGRSDSLNDETRVFAHVCAPAYALEALDGTTLHLLQHFSNKIAAEMTVIDDASNGWRFAVLPKAHEDSVVRFAVVAAATLHLQPHACSSASSTHPTYTQALTELRKRRNLQAQTTDGQKAVLLALLVLLAISMIQGSADFRAMLHLIETAITVIGSEEAISTDDLGTFIIRQVRKYRGYASPMLSQAQGISVLSQTTPQAPSRSKGWEDFKSYYQIYSLTDRSLSIMYYLNALACDMYVHRAQRGCGGRGFHEQVELVRQHLDSLPSNSLCEHALIWPTFIAALESDTPSHRDYFRRALQRHHVRNGFKNILVALEYLEGRWAEDGVEVDWTRSLPKLGAFVV
ncbi:uncharacterized protein AB675_7154 [Cyphellophora attinorum]|uniref:Acyltransferase 3 domain-containing protein n=1 Tax=Cyphellophora attinorum TaxID=1664694 RepID=A0A0N1P254_9EURO|nr:uncharacterized protein AB675_7154 [Phialophora attinorum]KPI43315.1 hypothetical protein AB675_7154 [Phialophora attinorum]